VRAAVDLSSDRELRLSSDGSDGSDSNASDGSDLGSDMDSPRCLSECDAEVLMPVRAILDRCGVGAGAGFFAVTSGPCTVTSDASCFRSPSFPSNYDNNQQCIIAVTAHEEVTLLVTAFSTESGYDYLIVDGVGYSGSGSGLAGVQLDASATITFTSDGSVTSTGFEICGAHPEHCLSSRACRCMGVCGEVAGSCSGCVAHGVASGRRSLDHSAHGWGWKLCLQRARRPHPLHRPRHYRHRFPQVLTVQPTHTGHNKSLGVLSLQRGSAPGWGGMPSELTAH
jgi:hypothetical protein